MEPIILLIISLIVGSLMKGSDKKKTPGNRPPRPEPMQQKPLQQGPAQPKPGRAGGLRDLTRQLYEDLQQEVKKEMKEFREEPRREEREERPRASRPGQPDSPAPAAKERKKGREPSQRRGSVRAGDLTGKGLGETADDPIRQGEIGSSRLLPETRDDLVRGVIFSEIFGPPKARRK
ncbi:hypothetical protein ACFFIY_11065 [Bhargavaea ullalensis]|uniref:Uncharacterized protein n=1 Tax=Bhargavaea ullalensis TaxID=1265685 RepID=A0ABV2G8Y8_9BACL